MKKHAMWSGLKRDYSMSFKLQIVQEIERDSYSYRIHKDFMALKK
jgi:transposase-like protein